MVGRECEGVEDAIPYRPRTQDRSRPIREMKGPSQDPCFDSKLGSILLTPWWAHGSHVVCPTPASSRHRCLHGSLLGWSVWEITNSPVSLIEADCEKWLDISLESELSQEGTGEPLRVIGSTVTRLDFCPKRVCRYFSTLSVPS